jgi:hypothetical protein
MQVPSDADKSNSISLGSCIVDLAYLNAAAGNQPTAAEFKFLVHYLGQHAADFSLQVSPPIIPPSWPSPAVTIFSSQFLVVSAKLMTFFIVVHMFQ